MKFEIYKAMFNRIILVVLFFTLYLSLFSQAESWKEKLPDFEIKPSINLQLWSSYTIGQEVYDEDTGQYNVVDDRLNFQLRRSRLGFKGQIYNNLKFNLTTAFDLVGRDVLSGTEAGSNNGSSPKLRLWNAYLQWKIIPGSEKLNLITGYFPVHIGRESITSAFRSTSMEKSWSQNYLRRHLTGIGPGRAIGANVGGLFLSESGNIHWGYNLGIFNPAFRDYNNNSVGDDYSPLLAGRLTVYIGDPEFRKFKIGHKVNYFGKRHGLSIALAGAHQGSSSLFKSNQAVGTDFLLNLGPLNIDGEWHYLLREGEASGNGEIDTYGTRAGTGYLRTSYNLLLKHEFVLEPVAMIVRFNGAMDAEGQENAERLQAFAGEETIVDLGVNFYFNPDLKLSLHYTHRDGDAGTRGDGATFNNYFSQSGIGAIQRGDWLGLGVISIF